MCPETWVRIPVNGFRDIRPAFRFLYGIVPSAQTQGFPRTGTARAALGTWLVNG